MYYNRVSILQDPPIKNPTDKFIAIKTAINFLSSVKPSKTGTNYPLKLPKTLLQKTKDALTHDVILDTYPHLK